MPDEMLLAVISNFVLPGRRSIGRDHVKFDEWSRATGCCFLGIPCRKNRLVGVARLRYLAPDGGCFAVLGQVSLSRLSGAPPYLR